MIIFDEIILKLNYHLELALKRPKFTYLCDYETFEITILKLKAITIEYFKSCF